MTDRSNKLNERKRKIDEMNRRLNMHPEDFKAMRIGETVDKYKLRMAKP